MNAHSLYARHSLERLQEMFSAERDNPDNKNTGAGIAVYTKKAQRRIDAIADAISLHLKDRKIAAGTYETNGYSGRISNRRG